MRLCSETVQWDCVDSGSATAYFSCTYTLSHLPRNTPSSFSLRRERSTPEERLQSQTSCVAVTSRLNGSTSTRHPHTSPSRIRCRTWKRRKGSACPLIPLACSYSVAGFHSHVALRCLLFCSLKKKRLFLVVHPGLPWSLVIDLNGNKTACTVQWSLFLELELCCSFSRNRKWLVAPCSCSK